jgi:hypothetical protein
MFSLLLLSLKLTIIFIRPEIPSISGFSFLIMIDINERVDDLVL